MYVIVLKPKELVQRSPRMLLCGQWGGRFGSKVELGRRKYIPTEASKPIALGTISNKFINSFHRLYHSPGRSKKLGVGKLKGHGPEVALTRGDRDIGIWQCMGWMDLPCFRLLAPYLKVAVLSKDKGTRGTIGTIGTRIVPWEQEGTLPGRDD